jgi:hypothetical protein
LEKLLAKGIARADALASLQLSTTHVPSAYRAESLLAIAYAKVCCYFLLTVRLLLFALLCVRISFVFSVHELVSLERRRGEIWQLRFRHSRSKSLLFCVQRRRYFSCGISKFDSLSDFLFLGH